MDYWNNPDVFWSAGQMTATLGTLRIRIISSRICTFEESSTNREDVPGAPLLNSQDRAGGGGDVWSQCTCQAPLWNWAKFYWATSPQISTHLLSVFVTFHLQTEGLQNFPQLTGLDQTSLVNINELQGFDNSFNVFENLCRKKWFRRSQKRPCVKNQNGHLKKKCEHF